MMETNLSNGMNDRSYSRFFGFVIVMSAVLFSFSSCLEGKKEEGVKTAEALILSRGRRRETCDPERRCDRDTS